MPPFFLESYNLVIGFNKKVQSVEALQLEAL
jgi:hypothetical protein